MFVKVVHDQNCFTLYECDSYQYSREQYDGLPYTVLYMSVWGELVETVKIGPKEGEVVVYIMNSQGATIDRHHILMETLASAAVNLNRELAQE
jgi:hypothetical protein